MTYFPTVEKIIYEGTSSSNHLAYRYYNPNKIVLGKRMEDILKIGACCWHTVCWQGNDIFGESTFKRNWFKDSNNLDCAKTDALFEFVTKLGIPYFSFHDTDLISESDSFSEFVEKTKQHTDYILKKMDETKIKLLLGTSNLFSHPRFMSGASTSPNPEIFCYAAAKVKNAMDLTHKLNGQNYVLWGGREGYNSILNTCMKKEMKQLGKFVNLVVEYKHKIGFKGDILIEPKPCEPSKHQYDFDVSTVFAFLKNYGLEKEVKVNIEANHATLAGHSFAHEVETAFNLNIFGSIDANRGDPQLGWDTDQFPNNLEETVFILYSILKNGGFKNGGFNFDAKLRRQSTDLNDLFYSHIGGIDLLAKSLIIAEKIINDHFFDNIIKNKYASWDSKFGNGIMNDEFSLKDLYDHMLLNNLNPKVNSENHELTENLYNKYLWEIHNES